MATKDYSKEPLYDLLGSPFGPNWQTAAAYALAESDGNPDAKSPNPSGGENRGLFQIDTKTAQGAGFDPNRLFEPQYNAMVASKLSKRGTDWHIWATSNPRSPRYYKKFLNAVGAKLPDADDAGLFGIGRGKGADTRVSEAADSIPKFLGSLGEAIFSAEWWLRVGKIALGIIALVMAVSALAKELTGISPASAIPAAKVAKAAA